MFATKTAVCSREQQTSFAQLHDLLYRRGVRSPANVWFYRAAPVEQVPVCERTGACTFFSNRTFHYLQRVESRSTG